MKDLSLKLWKSATCPGRQPETELQQRLWSCLVTGLLTLAVSTAALQAQGRQTEKDVPFRFGFSTVLLKQFNANDSKAAMKIWAETLIKQGNLLADPEMRVYQNLQEIRTAVSARDVDGLVLAVDEYFHLKDQVSFNRVILNVTDASVSEEYLLLVHQDSKLNSVQDLKGHSLNVWDHPRLTLARLWIDTLLLENGIDPANHFSANVREENKLTKVVIPVFFRKVDACVVTKRGFRTMGEMNPQIAKTLRVIASSPELVPTGFFLRDNLPKEVQDRIVRGSFQIHTTTAGQQVMTVFQVDKLGEFPLSILDPTLRLLEKHAGLVVATSQPKAVSLPSGSFPSSGQSR